MATNDPERSNSEQQSPVVAASDSSILLENKTEDTQELAVWKLESDRRTWEDYLCPVWNKALRDQKTVDTKPNLFRGYHKLPITHYRTLADRYKQKDHNIKVAVWVPKHPGMEKCPILVKFHGGGLIFGDCDEESTFAHHLIQLARINKAIIVAPNHRLMPEADGHEINDDIDTFWNSWFSNGRFSTFLKVNTRNTNINYEIDYERILLSGDSSGAIPVMHTWLTQPDLGIKAIYLQYPLLHHYSRTCGEGKINIGGVEITVDDMNKYMASYKDELERLISGDICPIRSASRSPEGALMNNYLPICNRWKYAYNCDSVAERIMKGTRNEVPGTSPQICIFHGDIDERIPREQNYDVLRALTEKWEGKMMDRIHTAKAVGMGHGKDKDMQIRDAEFLQYLAWIIEREWGAPDRVEEAKEWLAGYEM